jgi:hypothetical protein
MAPLEANPATVRCGVRRGGNIFWYPAVPRARHVTRAAPDRRRSGHPAWWRRRGVVGGVRPGRASAQRDLSAPPLGARAWSDTLVVENAATAPDHREVDATGHGGPGQAAGEACYRARRPVGHLTRGQPGDGPHTSGAHALVPPQRVGGVPPEDSARRRSQPSSSAWLAPWACEGGNACAASPTKVDGPLPHPDGTWCNTCGYSCTSSSVRRR